MKRSQPSRRFTRWSIFHEDGLFPPYESCGASLNQTVCCFSPFTWVRVFFIRNSCGACRFRSTFISLAQMKWRAIWRLRILRSMRSSNVILIPRPSSTKAAAPTFLPTNRVRRYPERMNATKYIFLLGFVCRTVLGAADWEEPKAPIAPEADGFVVIPGAVFVPDKSQEIRAVF